MNSDNLLNTCVICLEDINYNEYIINLPCNHYYHKECVYQWIIKNQNYDDLEKKRNAVQKDFDNSKTLTEKKIPEIIISLSDQIFEKILGEKKKSNLSEFKKFTESSK